MPRTTVDWVGQPETLEVYPSGGPLPANGRLILAEYNFDEAHLHDLAGVQPHLEADGAPAVPLPVQEWQKGEVASFEAILVPTEPLIPGNRYRLTFGNPLLFKAVGESGPGRPPAGLPAVAALSWTIAPPLESAPRWLAAPHVIGSSECSFWERLMRQCHRPERYFYISTELADPPSTAAIRVDQMFPGGSRKRRFYLPVSHGQIAVGTNFMGGPFVMAEGDRVELQLTAVDLAGHEAPAPGGSLQVTGFAQSDH